MHYDKSIPYYSKLGYSQRPSRLTLAGMYYNPPPSFGLYGSTLVSSTGEPTPRPYGYSKYSTETDSDLAACLPPDLRHLLSATSQTQSQLASCTNAMSTLGLYKKPYESYLADRMQTSRQATLFGEDDHRSRALGDRNAYDIYRSTNNMPDMDRRYNYQRSTTSGRLRAPRSAYAKHLSDMCVYGDGQDLDVGYRNDYTLRPRSRSYESGAPEDPSRRHWDNSYLSSVYGGNPGALRETAINSVLDHERRRMHPEHKRWDMRRFSDGSDSRPLDYMKYRRSRSWDPSPYSSEDEEEELQREEKKARIKAEIARRRRQIEENVRLHEELLRLARIRENAEHEYSPLSGGFGRRPLTEDECEVFTRAAEKIAEERSMERIASTFRTEDYTRGLYERLVDFSPIADFNPPHAMPLLPDMPTRSRRLLENLGSSPITESVLLEGERQKQAAAMQKKVNFLDME